jgi:predicted alpha/beta-fold hydrolase
MNKKDEIIDGHPIVVITHGLTGGSDSNYIKNCAEAIRNAGYTVVCYN